MIYMKDANKSKIKVKIQAKIATKAIGKHPLIVKAVTKGVINDVLLIPGTAFYLISSTKLLTLGFESHGNKNKMVYTKGNAKLIFDIEVKSPQRMLLAARLNRTAMEVGGVATMAK